MVLEIIQQILAVYSWAVIGALLVFLWHVAGFYERASGERVGHRFLLIPAALLTAGVAWYLGHDSDFVGQPLGDALLFAGGLLLLLFSNRLQKLMTGE